MPVVQELEHIDYYCPDCKKKSKCESSDVVQCQQKARHVRNFLFCSFHLGATEFVYL